MKLRTMNHGGSVFLLSLTAFAAPAYAEDNVFAEEPGTTTQATPGTQGSQSTPAPSGKRPPPRETEGFDPLLSRDTPAKTAAPAPAPVHAAEPTDLRFKPVGGIEAYYSVNFNTPTNGLTAFRGFDAQHNSITMSNAYLGGVATLSEFSARLVLQWGPTGAAYYSAEPVKAGGGGVPASNPNLWQYVQEATFTFASKKVHLEGGLFLSPIGPEGMLVADNWNYSRSNLFYALPYYHMGLRFKYAVTDDVSLVAMIVNGWNNVVDNNVGKTFIVGANVHPSDHIEAQVLANAGIERETGAAEGQPWRMDFDAWLKVNYPKWGLMAHLNGGFEPNRFGTSSFWGGAIYGRYALVDKLWLAARVDRFAEKRGNGPTGAASPIFLAGSDWVTSLTATLAWEAHQHLDIRMEVRRDMSASPLYFRDTAPGNGVTAPFLPNAFNQTTLLLGAIVHL